MTKIIIIDDDENGKELLQQMLLKHYDDIEVLGTAGNTLHGLSLINSQKPDLIFLDIELQMESGFQLQKKINEFNFEVILTTAYEQYAIRALKINVLDYLLKPINIEDLKKSLIKYHVKSSLIDNSRGCKTFVRDIQKIGIPTEQGVFFMDINNIIRCESRDSFTLFYIKNNRKILASKSIQEFEPLLVPHGFFRVHDSQIINLDEVEMYLKENEGTAVLYDGSNISISKSKKEEFMSIMRF